MSGELARRFDDDRLPDGEIGELIPLVYEELRAIARTLMRGERDGHTLQTTALVHEVYLRLLSMKRFEGGDTRAFLKVAARTMRRVLIDHSRAVGSLKRGGHTEHIPIESLEREISAHFGYPQLELIALDVALERLAAVDARKAQVVELKFFAGLSHSDAAQVLGVTRRTIDNDWNYARPWLIRELDGVGAS